MQIGHVQQASSACAAALCRCLTPLTNSGCLVVVVAVALALILLCGNFWHAVFVVLLRPKSSSEMDLPGMTSCVATSILRFADGLLLSNDGASAPAALIVLVVSNTGGH